LARDQLLPIKQEYHMMITIINFKKGILLIARTPENTKKLFCENFLVNIHGKLSKKRFA